MQSASRIWLLVLLASLLGCGGSGAVATPIAPAAVLAETPRLDAALRRAGAKKRRVVVVVHAEWCEPCNELQAQVLETERGSAALGDHELLLADFDQPDGHALAQEVRVLGLPTAVVLAPTPGGWVETGRVEGFEQAADWLSGVTTALAAGPSQPAACPPGLLTDPKLPAPEAIAVARCQAGRLAGPEHHAAAAALSGLLDTLPQRTGDSEAQRAELAGTIRLLGRHAARVLQRPERCADVFHGLLVWAALPQANLGGVVYWNAKCLIESGRQDEAWGLGQGYLQLAGRSYPARALVADLWVHAHARHDETLALLDGLLRENPADAWTWYLRGEVRHQQRDDAAARSDWQQALRLQPGSALFARSLRKLDTP